MENPDSGRTPVYNRVFIDTNLDTHLAVTVSDTDTFGDLKKKILLEHSMCFPSVGDIQISAIKMKLRGRFYHVSDLSLITNNGAGKRLFLYVDATVVGKDDENQELLQIGGSMEVIGTGKCLLLDGPKTSDTGDRSMLVRGSKATKLSPSDSQLGSNVSLEEVLKDSEKEAEQNASYHLDTSLRGGNGTPMEDIAVAHGKVLTVADNNLSVLGLLVKSNDLVTSSVSMDTNTKTDTRDVLRSVALKEASNGEAVENRQHNCKRKTTGPDSLTHEENSGDLHVFALTSKDPENCPDDVDKLSIDTVGKDKMAFESLEKATLDAMEQSRTEGEIANILVQMIGAVEDVVLHEKDVNAQDTNKLLEEVSPPLPAAKKKQKVGKKSSKEDSSNGYSDLTTNKGTTAAEVISANQITTDSTVVKNPLTASPSTGKKKKKTKSSKDINQDAGPLSSSPKYLADEAVVAPMEEPHVENFGAEPDELNKNLVEKESESGGMDVDDLGCRKAPSIALDNPHGADVSIGTPVTDEVGNPDIVAQEFKKPEDIGYSEGRIDGLNDNKAATTETPLGVEGQLLKSNEEGSLANNSELENNADRAKSVKTSKSKKKMRKTKDQTEGTLVTSNSQQVESSGDPTSSREPVKAVHREEPNNIIKNVLESLQQSNEEKEISEKDGEQSRKKTKKKRKLNEVDTKENIVAHGPTDEVKEIDDLAKTPKQAKRVKKGVKDSNEKKRKSKEVDAKENNVAHGPTDEVKGIDDMAKTPKKAKRAKKGVKDSNETKNELKNNPEVDTDSVHIKQHPADVGSLQDKSHNPNGSSDCEPKGVAQGDLFGGDPAHETSKTEMTLGKEKLIVNDNFSSEQKEHDDTVSNGELRDQGVDKTKPSVDESKTAKNKKMTDLLPGDTKNVSRSLVKQEKRSSRKAQPIGSETSQQQSKVKNDLPNSKKKVQKLTEGKSSSYLSDKNEETLGAVKPAPPGDTGDRSRSKKKKHAPAGSDSSFIIGHGKSSQPSDGADAHGSQMKSSAKGVATNKSGEVVKRSRPSATKASSNKKQKDVNGSDNVKNLPMSGLIFNDHGNWNSEDDEADSSDGSTKSPSGVSSDYSDGDSVATFTSPKIGSNQKENDGRNTPLPSSTPKEMNLQKILRSSRRFKKAKLSASQSQPDKVDEDILPFECVPDSQPR